MRLCFLLLLLFGVYVTRATEILPFSELKAGEEIRIEFKSHGCFHSSTNVLAIKRDKQIKVVLVQALRTTTERGGAFPNSKQSTSEKELSLTADETAGQDRLLEYYRTRHSGMCTTVDEVTFSHVKAGKTVMTEKFKDESCGLLARLLRKNPKEPKITSIQELLSRFEKL